VQTIVLFLRVTSEPVLSINENLTHNVSFETGGSVRKLAENVYGNDLGKTGGGILVTWQKAGGRFTSL